MTKYHYGPTKFSDWYCIFNNLFINTIKTYIGIVGIKLLFEQLFCVVFDKNKLIFEQINKITVVTHKSWDIN